MSFISFGRTEDLHGTLLSLVASLLSISVLQLCGSLIFFFTTSKITFDLFRDRPFYSWEEREGGGGGSGAATHAKDKISSTDKINNACHS